MGKASSFGNKLASLVIVVFGVYSYLFFSVLFNTLIGSLDFIDENKNLYLMLSLLGSLGLYCLILLFFHLFTRDGDRRPPTYIRPIFYLEILLMGLILQCFVLEFFYTLQPLFMPSRAEVEFALLMESHAWYVLVLSLVVAPIFEELLFRKYVLGLLTKSFSPAWSIAISALVFGAYHLTLRQFLFSSLLGLLLGLVYYKTAKLSLSMVLHLSFNASAFLAPYLMHGFRGYLGPYAPILSLPLIGILGLVSVIIVLKQMYHLVALNKRAIGRVVDSEDEA